MPTSVSPAVTPVTAMVLCTLAGAALSNRIKLLSLVRPKTVARARRLSSGSNCGRKHPTRRDLEKFRWRDFLDVNLNMVRGPQSWIADWPDMECGREARMGRWEVA